MLDSYAVILNPEARSVLDADGLEDAIRRLPSLRVLETRAPEDAARHARAAAADGCACVVAVGGDGTLNEVLNGLMEAAERPALGLIPLGTGNDFARTVGIPVEPDGAVDVLLAGRSVDLDAMRLDTGDGTRWALNAVTGGFSTTVDENLTPETKEFFGRLSFLVSAGSSLPELQPYSLRVEVDGRAHELEAYTLAVVNGRTTAGGITMAAEACLTDGQVRLIVVPALPLTRFAPHLARLLRGEFQDVPELFVREARRVRIEATPRFRITVDGEIGACTPVELAVAPLAVRFVVGDAPDGVIPA